MTHDPDLIRKAQEAHSYGLDKLTQIFPAVIMAVIEHRAWEGRPDSQGLPFPNFFAFATAALWEGLGLDGKRGRITYDDAIRYSAVRRPDVAAILRQEMPVPLTHQEAGKLGGRGNTKARANGTSFSRGSNQAPYLVRRLKRDAPDIAQALARGEYRSARAAGIAAGIVRVPTSLEVAQRAFRKLTAKERVTFLAWTETLDAEGDDGSG